MLPGAIGFKSVVRTDQRRISGHTLLLRAYDFLILDEATSAIDPFREKAMYDTFRRELEGKTGIIITHRLGAVSIADRVIVLEHGRIVQAGTHEQLLKEEGLYLTLWNSQATPFCS